jgi:twitching motility protein PilU
LSADVIFGYLRSMNDHKASDLYLTVGFAPTLRTETGFVKIEHKPLSAEEINEIIAAMMTNRQKREFDTAMEMNSSLDMGQHGRFRVNALRQRQNPALVIRRIISKIPSFADLLLPKVLESLALEKRGMVLLTGMTGSGKSTTLASMIDFRNSMQEGHIITIEDPIEYFHEHKKSVITQREVGVDTESYSTALKNALRQRPDVILVGEIRDREVMEQALMASETGHLCLATIHTNNAYQAIERILNMFPEESSQQIRLGLSANLKAIISQRLIPATNGSMVPAIEVMLNQGLVRELIMKGELPRIKDVMEQNNSLGMCTFDQSLLKLYNENRITSETALANSDRPTDMKLRLQQSNLSGTKSRGAEGLHKLDVSVISFKD